MLFKVGRSGDDDTAQMTEPLCNQGRILEFANAHTEIESFFDQIDHAIQQLHIDTHFRVALNKARDGIANMQLSEEHG